MLTVHPAHDGFTVCDSDSGEAVVKFDTRAEADELIATLRLRKRTPSWCAGRRMRYCPRTEHRRKAPRSERQATLRDKDGSQLVNAVPGALFAITHDFVERIESGRVFLFKLRVSRDVDRAQEELSFFRPCEHGVSLPKVTAAAPEIPDVSVIWHARIPYFLRLIDGVGKQTRSQAADARASTKCLTELLGRLSVDLPAGGLKDWLKVLLGDPAKAAH